MQCMVDSFQDLTNYVCVHALHNFVCIIFAVEVKFAKTVNIMRSENLALYGIP